MAKANQFYLFDEPGVEKVIREFEGAIDLLLATSSTPEEAVQHYRKVFPDLYSTYADFGAYDSEPMTEACERIADGLAQKLGKDSTWADRLFEVLRWEE